MTHQDSVPAADWTDEHRRVWRAKPALRQYYEQQYFRRIVEAMPPGRSLEIGAGPGFFRDYHRCDVVSDITPAPHVDRTVDAHAMPFSDAEFDAVVGIDVIHHFRDPATAIGEMARVLKPGSGRLILVEPWTGPLGYFFCRYIHHEDCFRIDDPWKPVFGSDKDPMQGNAEIPKTYFDDHAAALLDRCGLKVLRLEPFSFFGYVATGGFTRYSLPATLAKLIAGVENMFPLHLSRLTAVKVFIVAGRV